MARSRIQSVELIVPAGFTANQIKFPDQPTLRSDLEKDAVIFTISLKAAVEVPFTVAGPNNPVATYAQIQNAFLTLQILGKYAIKDIAMTRFVDGQQFAAGYVFAAKRQELAPERVEWTESFVTLSTPGTSETAQYSFLFEFEYEWLPVGAYGKWLTNRNNKWGAGIIQE